MFSLVAAAVLLVAPRGFRAQEAPAAVCAGGRRPASLMVLLVAPLVFRAQEAPAAVCAGGRRPAREPSALRASLGASPRSPARPRHRPPAPRQIPPAPSTPAALCRWSVAGCVGSKPGQAPPPPTGTAA